MIPKHRTRWMETIMRSGVNKTQADKLIDAGLDSARLLREATDDELLAIEGIGRGTLKKIRAWVGG